MAAPTRTSTVLPILKTLIWAIIAIALVKFAFFPAGSTAVGAWTSRSPIVRPGNWSWAWAARKLWGNQAYYRFS